MVVVIPVFFRDQQLTSFGKFIGIVFESWMMSLMLRLLGYKIESKLKVCIFKDRHTQGIKKRRTFGFVDPPGETQKYNFTKFPKSTWNQGHFGLGKGH